LHDLAIRWFDRAHHRRFDKPAKQRGGQTHHRQAQDLSVHEESGVSAIGFSDGTFGVEGVFAFCFAGSPFEFSEVGVIGGVNDGDFALG